MLHVDVVHVVDELHDRRVIEVFVEPAAELRREVVLAIGERARAAEAAHDAARLAADAALDLARRNRADAMIDVLAALEHEDLHGRFLLDQFIRRHHAGRAAAGHAVSHIAAQLTVCCSGIHIGAASPVAEGIDLSAGIPALQLCYILLLLQCHKLRKHMQNHYQDLIFS